MVSTDVSSLERPPSLTVLSGHAGSYAVDYIVVALPGELKGRLASLVHFASAVEPEAVNATIQDAITTIDERIGSDLVSLFPGGVDSLATMTDGDIKAIINDKDRGATNIMKVLRARQGATALVVLQDPSRDNIWIAGLGDCSASTFSLPCRSSNN
jgi:pyruvate dehydrogenase phosphatase